MARTWPASPTKRAALAVLDTVGYTVAIALRLFRRRRSDGEIAKILVVEPWNIGDVVLATPLLAEIRKRFPNAVVKLLGKPHAWEILRDTALVDEVIEANLPWTRHRGKYRVSRAEKRVLRRLVRRLRNEKFDLVFDARGDIRTHAMIAFARPKRSVGYDKGGGWLLTDALPDDPDKGHKIADWLNLLGPFGGVRDSKRQPALIADASRVKRVREELLGDDGASHPIVAFHPGGSHAGKRWPLESFAAVAREIGEKFGGSTILLVEPGGYGRQAEWPSNVKLRQGGISDLMAVLSNCDALVCNDSGPMHLADALGVPVVAVFERGNPQWFGPSGEKSRVVNGELAGIGVHPGPVNDPPVNPVAVKKVFDALAALLAELDFRQTQWTG